jgi:hypothetical protein
MSGWVSEWSWIILEKLIVTQPVKKFPAFYGTRRFITVFTRSRHWSLSWARWIQSIPPPHFPRILLPSRPTSSTWSLPFRFSDQNFVCPVKRLPTAKRKLWFSFITLMCLTRIPVVVFWIMTPYSEVVGYKHFGGPCCFHLQGIIPEHHDKNLHRRENPKSRTFPEDWDYTRKLFIGTDNSKALITHRCPTMEIFVSKCVRPQICTLHDRCVSRLP